MRILILGHNPFNKELPNGRTLLELFSGYQKTELADIYLHLDKPNFEVCNRYYRITDAEVFKNCLTGKKTGKIINTNEPFVAGNEAAYSHGSKHRSYTVLLRNLVWKFSHWFNKDIKEWIADFKPDILFLYLGNYTFSINIAMKIAKYFDIPIVSYIVDDYYFNKNLKHGVWGGINHFLYCRKLKKLLNGRTTICLNDAMKNKYASEFNGNFKTIYTTSSMRSFFDSECKSTIRMSYLGGISCGRNYSLAEIGETISKCNLPIEFSVYTRDTRERFLKPLKEANGVNLNGGVDYEEVIKIMGDSDVLVHVEGFDQESQDRVRFSMSTKIADTLSSNRCMLAYGPRGIASIDYLVENDCAFVASSGEELKDILSTLCMRPETINSKNARALAVAKENHTRQGNRIKLNNIFEQVVSK